MGVHTHAEILAHAESIADLRKRVPSSYRPSELYNLRILAVMCGYPADRMEGISPADLKTLLDTAFVKVASAVMVTARIARANGVEIDPNAVAASAPGILDEPEPEPAPTPSSPPSGPGADYVTSARFAREIKGLSDTLKEYGDDRGAANLQVCLERIEALAGSIPVSVALALEQQTATRLVVTTPNAPAPVVLGLVHKQTGRIIRALGAGLHVYLHGPAGAGKTTAGRKCADAFGLPFYTAAKVESEYLLMGFRNAMGEVVRTPFREAYEHGGVFLFDELDASSPGAIVALNMALANGMCPFPDGLVMMHANFKCIAAGNTVLTGATRQYAGRMQMDAASIDRFYFIEFGYDENLETELATNKVWARHVQTVRRHVGERGLSLLVTPRATFDGCKALEAGDTWAEAEMSCIFKGLDKETVDVVRRAVLKTSNGILD